MIVNVASGHYMVGQKRLVAAAHALGEKCMTWAPPPRYWPGHWYRPYAFKAFALEAAAHYDKQLLWADACIVPERMLAPIWEHAAKHGVWIARNGYNNYEWTADYSYPYLFRKIPVEEARAVNRTIDHVIATAFAIDLRTENGCAFLNEYMRLARDTDAFCGPWINSNYPGAPPADGHRIAPCGPPDVRGHRHDQTAASVIAWRLKIPLDESGMFVYAGNETDHTILSADGNY